MEQGNKGTHQFRRNYPMNKQQSFIWYTLLFLSIFFIDRATKYGALLYCQQLCYVNQFLSFDFALNRGISWGLLHSQSDWIFTLVSLVIFLVTLWVMWLAWQRLVAGHWIFGEALIIAGSLSNIFDRVVYGGVIDFIVLSYKDWSWPIFNVADASIVLGVGIMFLHYYKKQ